MVGSQGTLGFVASGMTLRTVPEPPARATALLYFAELREAGEAVAPLAAAGRGRPRDHGRGVAALAGRRPVATRSRSAPARRRCSSRCGRRTRRRSARLVEEARRALGAARLLTPAEFTTDPAQRERHWTLRKGLFPSVGGMRASGTAVVIEDVGFPLERLADAITDLQALFARHGFDDAIVFGHAKDGNLHFVFARDFARPATVARYAGFMRDLAELVVGKYDGALKAEHGSGRNIAPFVRDEWGESAYAVMRRIKDLLDPDGILNPDVVLTDDAELHLKHLKALPTISPLADTLHRVRVLRAALPVARPHPDAAPAHRGDARAVAAPEGGHGGVAHVARGAPRRLRLRGHPDLRRRLDVHDLVPGEDRHGRAGQGDRRRRRTRSGRAGSPSGWPGGSACSPSARGRGSRWRAALGRLPGGLAAPPRGLRASHRLAPTLVPRRLARAPSCPSRRRPCRSPPRPAAARVVYFASCLTRVVGSLPGEARRPRRGAMVDVLPPAGFDGGLPAGPGGALLRHALREQRRSRRRAAVIAARTAEALWTASRDGRDAVVTDASPCARRP